MLEAREYYEEQGFKYVDVPWAVSRKAILLTRPPHITAEPMSMTSGGMDFYPVASAEQSFLQMQMDALAAAPSACQCSFAFPMSAEAMAKHIEAVHSRRITGSYCAITPCFRNEPKLDDQHQPYFLKCELISWVPTDGKLIEQVIQMHHMIGAARQFFEDEGLEVECVPNPEGMHDPIGVNGQAFDVVSFRTNVEVGSYGIREHASVGRWIYGTGIAEPRFSYALIVEEAAKESAGNA